MSRTFSVSLVSSLRIYFPIRLCKIRNNALPYKEFWGTNTTSHYKNINHLQKKKKNSSCVQCLLICLCYKLEDIGCRFVGIERSVKISEVLAMLLPGNAEVLNINLLGDDTWNISMNSFIVCFYLGAKDVSFSVFFF